MKFIACDFLIAEDNQVYVTELCPPLSCTRAGDVKKITISQLEKIKEQANKIILIQFSILALIF